MSLAGIGKDGASPLERFQQARDVARKKLEGDDSRFRLADILQRKKTELGGNSAQAARFPVRPQAQASIEETAAKAEAPEIKEPRAYGRGGAVNRPDPKPVLGRHVDFMA